MQRAAVRSLISFSLVASAGYALAIGTISSVETRKVGEGVEVFVRGEGLAKPREEKAMRNAVHIFSFAAQLKTTGRRETMNYGGVSTVQWTQFTTRPMVARLVFRLRPTDTPIVRQVEGGWLISVNTPTPTNVVAQPDNPLLIPNRPIVLLDPEKPVKPTVSEVSDFDPTGITVVDEGTKAPLPRVSKETPRTVASGAVTATSSTVSTSNVLQSKRISLDFADTDVVLILKALAAQADVNIVTSPDVKGQISVSLKNVTVDEALTVVTAIADLRYQKLDRTIIVASPDRLSSIIRNASMGSSAVTAETEIRIVPIYSKQGRQVKSALYRVLPQDARTGRYEVALPSEQMVQEAPKTADGKPADAAGPAATNEDEYIMIIGSRTRLAEVERTIRSLDQQIADAIGIETPSSSALVTETYYVQGASATDLASALGVDKGKLGNIQVVATPAGSSARPSLVITGRENEVRRVVNTLKELDGGERPQDEIKLYEVRFSDPRALRDELMLQVPGIRASIPPAGVGNVRVYVPSSGKVTSPGEKAGGGEGQATTTTSAAQAAIEKSTGLQSGLTLPFNALEPSAVPMRLILRGDKSQLDRAYKLMAELDKEPRQLAIEVRVMELRKDDAVNAGIDWNLFTGGAVKFIRLNNSLSNPNNRIGAGFNNDVVSGDVVATLDGIANKNNLIARPNMVAYDGRESELFIGDVIRYVESITSSQNGPSVQIGEVRVGVNLAVLPRLSADGTATLDLRPTVSFLREFRQYQLSGFTAELPQTSERQTQQTLNVRSGETIAIGGLITEEMVTNVSGVPILMDLPILGQFFRSTRTRKDRRELVIFITTNIVNSPLGAETKLPMNNDVPVADAKNGKDK